MMRFMATNHLAEVLQEVDQFQADTKAASTPDLVVLEAVACVAVIAGVRMAAVVVGVGALGETGATRRAACADPRGRHAT